MPAQNNSRIAAGTINICTFLQSGAMVSSIVNAANGELTALQCTGSGVEILGIAQEFTNNMMGQALAPAQGFPAATAGQQVKVYGDGEECMAIGDSGYNVVQDQLLASDASGNAIPISSTNTSKTAWVGARAIESGIAGDPIRVTVVLRPPPILA